MEFKPRSGDQFSDLVEISRPQLLVEIGTWHGASLISFLQSARELGLTTAAIAVDTWLGSVEHWIGRLKGEWARSQLKLEQGEPNFINDFRSNVKAYGFESQVEIIRAPSEAGLSYLLQARIKPDLIYIDGDHSYGAVKSDIALAMQFTAEAGPPLLAGDDWAWASVRRAVMFSAIRYGRFIWIKGNMWTLGKASSLNSALVSRGWKLLSPLQYVVFYPDLPATRYLMKRLRRRFIRSVIDPIFFLINRSK